MSTVFAIALKERFKASGLIKADNEKFDKSVSNFELWYGETACRLETKCEAALDLISSYHKEVKALFTKSLN